MIQQAGRGGRRGLLIVGLLAGLTIAAEVSLQTWARYFRTPFETFDRTAGAPTLVPGVYETRFGRVEVNESGFVGAPLVQADASGTAPDLFRIVSLGDSCTFGSGNQIHTYPAMLQDHLQRIGTSGHRYEVVNAGISGLDSEQALRRLTSAIPPLEPDVVILYVGWNDLMKFSPRSQMRGGVISDVSRFIDRLWLARGARKALFFYARPKLSTPATGPSSHTGQFNKFTPSYFEENLREMVRAARQLGARPVLLTLPTSVREIMQDEDLRHIRAQFPYFLSAFAVGDFLDLLASYNRAIQRTAIEEQVPLVDLARIFASLPRSTELFFDSMHTSARGMELIALAIADVLEREGLLAPPVTSRATPVPGSGR